MSCIIWMLLEANNVWGNCLEYWQLRSALSGGLMVCIYLWQCTSHDPFFLTWVCNFIPFFVSSLLVWWLCVFVRVAGAAQTDLWSFHAHYLLQRLPRQSEWAGQAHQWWRALPHCSSEPRESITHPHSTSIVLRAWKNRFTDGVNWNLNEGRDND